MESLTNKNCENCDTLAECFKNLSEDQLDKISKNKVHLRYNKKETIVKQGSFASHIIFIREGYLKLYIESEWDAKDLIINIFGPNQLIGLSSLFESNTYQYSVAALIPSELCLFEVKDIQYMIGQNTEFALGILRRSHKSTIHAYNQMFNLTHKQLNGRIASAFLYLSRQVFHSDSFEMILSRSELANFTAMSTMSAVRTIKDLEKQGVITDIKGVIKINDFEALEKISKFG
ncbi:MAG: Crp/Fnr family transcriptional regulator [Bacteroidota bacterium]